MAAAASCDEGAVVASIWNRICVLFKQNTSTSTNGGTPTQGGFFGVSSRAEGGGAGRGGASFRRADAAQVCNNVGFVFLDGVFECSFATTARQIVSERW